MKRIISFSIVLAFLFSSFSCKKDEETFVLQEQLKTPILFFGDGSSVILKWESTLTKEYKEVYEHGVLKQQRDTNLTSFSTLAFTDKEVEYSLTADKKEEIISYLVTNNDQVSFITPNYEPDLNIKAVQFTVELKEFRGDYTKEIMPQLNAIVGSNHYNKNSFNNGEKLLMTTIPLEVAIFRARFDVYNIETKKKTIIERTHYMHRLEVPHVAKEDLEDL
jgi:hypothetical protein